MKDKEKLKKLVQIIGDLLKEEGNEWLIDEILKEVANSTSTEEIAKHSLIQEIYEHCLEKIIAKQANEFYASFPIAEIKDQLIQDYRKMEHERRRDDFESFGLCMFQQFEAINNYLFKNHIEPEWGRIKDIEVVKYKDKKTNNQVVKSLSEEALGKASNWNVFPKYKTVLFYYYFNQRAPLPYAYMKMKEVFYELYQIRNQNHREGDLFEFQEDILKSIKGNESKYYFKFYGFLQDFVYQIESSYSSNISNGGKKNKKSSNPKTQKNTIGANSPELEKLKQQMKKNE